MTESNTEKASDKKMENTKNEKQIIGIIGENGSGKDTFCNFFQKYLPEAEFLKFSDSLVDVLKIFFKEVSREDMQWLANNLRKRFGGDILTKAIERKIENSEKSVFVLNGLRVMDDYLFLQKKRGKLVYVAADERKRWERLQKRNEKKDDNVNFEEFLEREKDSTEKEIPEIGENAEFFIDNNGDLDKLEAQALHVIRNLKENL